MIEFTHHLSILEPFSVIEDRLWFGEIDIASKLSNEQSPIYIYSSKVLASRLKKIRSLMPAKLKLHFAVKANPFPDFLNAVKPFVDGFDVASGGEIQTLSKVEPDMSTVSFAGPGKTAAEIRLAVEMDVKIIVESPTQLRLTHEIAKSLGKTAKCLVRLNDLRESAGSGLNMSGRGNGFGWDINDYKSNALDIFEACENVEFYGFHLFFGSQILNPAAILKGLNTSIDTLKGIPAPRPPALINLGGGLGIPYSAQDKPLDINQMAPIWSDTVTTLSKMYPDTQSCIELGRYIAGPTGIYVCRIVDKKTVGGTTFVVCSGGLNHFSAATGNFGQALRRNHPVYPIANLGRDKETVTLIGPLCTPIDVFAKGVELPSMNVGDLVGVFQAGAYGYSASPLGFLSHDFPRQLVL